MKSKLAERNLTTFCREVLSHPEAKRALRREFANLFALIGIFSVGILVGQLSLRHVFDLPAICISASGLLLFWLMRFCRTLRAACREFHAAAFSRE